MLFDETVEQLRLLQRGCRVTSSGTGLLKPQHEFLDFAGTCVSEASFSGDDAKAALLEDATRRDATLSWATRAWSGRDGSTVKKALRAQVAIPCPSVSGRSST
jgi:hypothetical protein